MKKFLPLIFILFSLNIKAQSSVSASMGIDFIKTSSITDYLNENFNFSQSKLSEFNSTIFFSGSVGFLINENYELNLELGYLTWSNSTSSNLGIHNFSYNTILPSALVFYVVSGEGYLFKFGFGGGIRFSSLEETLPGFPTSANYNSTGFGGILRTDANTKLGGNFFATIGINLRFDIIGDLKNGDTPLFNPVAQENVNLNSFSYGIKLGILYKL